MYRWHFDSGESEVIVYADVVSKAEEKLRSIFPESKFENKWKTYSLIGVEEMLEDKIA